MSESEAAEPHGEDTEATPVAPRGPSPFALLFAPDRGMERQARVGKARWLFLFAMLCSLALGLALSYRMDAHSATLLKLEESGQLKEMSDRQVADETRNAERVAQVMSIAKGVTNAPVQLGLVCLSVLALTWFYRGRILGSAVAPVAAATMLPGAIANALDAVSAMRHAVIPPDGVPLSPRTLTAVLELFDKPLPMPWAKLGNALDFYSLWAAVMLAFGLVTAGSLPRRRAVIGTLAAWVCYRLLTHVAGGG